MKGVTAQLILVCLLMTSLTTSCGWFKRGTRAVVVQGIGPIAEIDAGALDQQKLRRLIRSIGSVSEITDADAKVLTDLYVRHTNIFADAAGGTTADAAVVARRDVDAYLNLVLARPLSRDRIWAATQIELTHRLVSATLPQGFPLSAAPLASATSNFAVTVASAVNKAVFHSNDATQMRQLAGRLFFGVAPLLRHAADKQQPGDNFAAVAMMIELGPQWHAVPKVAELKEFQTGIRVAVFYGLAAQALVMNSEISKENPDAKQFLNALAVYDQSLPPNARILGQDGLPVDLYRAGPEVQASIDALLSQQRAAANGVKLESVSPAGAAAYIHSIVHPVVDEIVGRVQSLS